MLRNFVLQWRRTADGWACTAKHDVFRRSFFLLPLHWTVTTDYYWTRLPGFRRTEVLLGSVTAGTRLWGRDAVRNLTFTKPDPIPPIAFDRPSTQEQLDEYWRWLLKMAGPERRFRDDWGHAIRLSIGGTSSAPIFIVSSAGPDGVWGTKDDMILKVECQDWEDRCKGKCGLAAVSSQGLPLARNRQGSLAETCWASNLETTHE